MQEHHIIFFFLAGDHISYIHLLTHIVGLGIFARSVFKQDWILMLFAVPVMEISHLFVPFGDQMLSDIGPSILIELIGWFVFVGIVYFMVGRFQKVMDASGIAENKESTPRRFTEEIERKILLGAKDRDKQISVRGVQSMIGCSDAAASDYLEKLTLEGWFEKGINEQGDEVFFTKRDPKILTRFFGKTRGRRASRQG